MVRVKIFSVKRVGDDYWCLFETYCDFAGEFQQIYDFRKIFSIAFPFANSSINLSR